MYVRQWRVIVNGDTGPCIGTYAQPASLQFCHAICQRPGLSLSFIVLVNETVESERRPISLFREHLDFDKAFSPLKVLRNVKNVRFQEAHYFYRNRDAVGEDIAKTLPG